MLCTLYITSWQQSLIYFFLLFQQHNYYRITNNQQVDNTVNKLGGLKLGIPERTYETRWDHFIELPSRI